MAKFNQKKYEATKAKVFSLPTKGKKKAPVKKSPGTPGTHFPIPANPYPKKVPKGKGYGV